MDKYGYIGIETLLDFCENSKDHTVTPNDFMRMERVNLFTVEPERKKGKWIPVTRIEKWHKEEGLVGFPPEVKEFPQCTIEWVDATEPDEVDGLRCSECGTVYDFTEARNWCSECGADMRGESDEAD